MKRIAMVLMGVVFGGMGCAQNLTDSVTLVTESLNDTTMRAAAMMTDQGVLDVFKQDAEGDFIDPGIEIKSGLMSVSTIRLIGTTGSIQFSAKGTGTQLPTDLRESLLTRLADPNISPAERSSILGILGWNRETSEQNPAPESIGIRE